MAKICFQNVRKENEEFGVDAKALVDSRIYERPSFFLGIPLIFIVFGGIGNKYESVFSVEYEGKAVVVLYHGLCLVSVGDRLLIRGKWYRGGCAAQSGFLRSIFLSDVYFREPLEY
jgi:hypothetical protein